MQKRILLTGANGQLGQCLLEATSAFPQFEWVATDRSSLDITDRTAVPAAVSSCDWCINCAAYTAVDKAERDADTARRINADGPRFLAEACAERDIPLIHISTDYVYHSRQNTPFREDDPVHPQGVYAATKLEGDLAVLSAHARKAMIVRTSWVYGLYGHNFLKTMPRLGRERPVLHVVADQIGSPTSAHDLAEALLCVVSGVGEGRFKETDLGGIWHYSNEGVASWYDFAAAIMDIAGLPCRVLPIETADYPTPAQRPPFSVLNKSKIKRAFGLDIPHWRQSLKAVMGRMNP